MKLYIDSKKIIFFLFIYYLCINPLLYIGSCYFTNGNIFLKGTGLDSIYLEQIVLLSTIFLILSGNINVNKYLNYHSVLAFLLFMWVCAIILFSFFDVGLINFYAYYGMSTQIIGMGFIFILFGLNIHVIYDIFLKKKYLLIFYALVTFYFTVIFLSCICNPLESNPWYIQGMIRTSLESDLLDYLYISETCALLLLFIITRVNYLSVKLLITAFGLFLIYLCGSRACFASFGVACFITLIIQILKMRFIKIVCIAISVILLISISIHFLLYLNKIDNFDFKDNRFNPYRLIKYDSSYRLRNEILVKGLSDLDKIWLLGRYMNESVEENDGGYIHNYLSFWSAFGIGPFLLFVLLLLSSFCKIVKQFLKDSNNPVNELNFLWGIYMITLIITSRSYTYYAIWFVLFCVTKKSYSYNTSKIMAQTVKSKSLTTN
jgi:hypothetical protein